MNLIEKQTQLYRFNQLIINQHLNLAFLHNFWLIFFG